MISLQWRHELTDYQPFTLYPTQFSMHGCLQEAGLMIWGNGGAMGYGRDVRGWRKLPRFDYRRAVDYAQALVWQCAMMCCRCVDRCADRIT